MNFIRKKLGLYSLKREGIKWVGKNLGEKYVNEFVEKYEKLNKGIPIGNSFETVVFLNMIEKIKREM